MSTILCGIRLDPRWASYPFVRSHIAMSYYFECDYETTVAEATRLIADHPDHPYAYRWLAAALGQLGRTDEARTRWTRRSRQHRTRSACMWNSVCRG